MNKSKKGYVPIMVKPETKQLVKDLMPDYEDTYDNTILVLLTDHGLLKVANKEIERLKKELRNGGK